MRHSVAIALVAGATLLAGEGLASACGVFFPAGEPARVTEHHVFVVEVGTGHPVS